MSLPHFTFSGNSYEQGLSHGEALRDSIEKNVDVYQIPNDSDSPPLRELSQ